MSVLQCSRYQSHRFQTRGRQRLHPQAPAVRDLREAVHDLREAGSKIEAGIIRSCHKRPVSSEQISSLVDQIENALFSREDREISSSVIGEMVMEKLKDLDPVAYVRFASVYREFKDVDTFMQELTKLLEHQERRKR